MDSAAKTKTCPASSRSARRESMFGERIAANMADVQIERGLPLNLSRMLPDAFRDLASLRIEDAAPISDKDPQ